ncbi:MAG: hypothetical protein JWR58_2693, partial [Pseudonocardia sp.]|nr:hypothetical protein [Pseudonocardia sp.]
MAGAVLEDELLEELSLLLPDVLAAQLPPVFDSGFDSYFDSLVVSVFAAS